MTDEEWHDYFAEHLPNIWPHLSAKQKALAVASAGLGFEVGKNQAFFEERVGGCIS